MDWNTVKEGFLTFVTTTGWNLLKTVLVFVAGYIVVRITLKIVKKILKRTKMESITQSFLISILKFTLFILLALITASTLGIELTGLVAILTAASLAVGLALQDSLSNLANGIIIITTKPFAEGDYVSINGVEGTVKHIKMLNTAITTGDGKLITLPNSSIVTSNVINYNTLGKRRVDFTFEVAYESDVKKVNEIILKVIQSNGKTHKDPAPFVSLKQLDASSLKFFANTWVDSEDYWDVYYYVLNNVFNEFKKENISVPYTQMEVRLRNDEVTMPVDDKPLEERVEKERKKQEKNNLFSKYIQKNPKEEKKKKSKKNNKKIDVENKEENEIEPTDDIKKI